MGTVNEFISNLNEREFILGAEQALVDTVQDLWYEYRNEIGHDIKVYISNHKDDAHMAARLKEKMIVNAYFMPYWATADKSNVIVFNELAESVEYDTVELGRRFYPSEDELFAAQKALAAHEFAHLLADERGIEMDDLHGSEFESILWELLDYLYI